MNYTLNHILTLVFVTILMNIQVFQEPCLSYAMQQQTSKPLPTCRLEGCRGGHLCYLIDPGDKHWEEDFYTVGKAFPANTQPRRCPFFAAKEDGLKIIWEEPWRANKNKWLTTKSRALSLKVWTLNNSDRSWEISGANSRWEEGTGQSVMSLHHRQWGIVISQLHERRQPNAQKAWDIASASSYIRASLRLLRWDRPGRNLRSKPNFQSHVFLQPQLTSGQEIFLWCLFATKYCSRHLEIKRWTTHGLDQKRSHILTRKTDIWTNNYQVPWELQLEQYVWNKRPNTESEERDKIELGLWKKETVFEAARGQKRTPDRGLNIGKLMEA